MSKKIIFYLIGFLISFSAVGKGKTELPVQNQKNLISEDEKRKFDYFFLEALRQKALGNRDAAADNLLRCYYIDSNNAAVFSELANLNISLNRISFARKYMEEAVRLDPDNFWIKQALAQIYIQNREYELASKLYEDILKTNPDKKDRSYILASLYSEMRQPEKAIKAWDDMEDEVGINDQISLEKFKLYLSLNQKKKAFKEIDKLIKAFPKNPKYQVLKGDLYLVLEDNKAAEKSYKEVFNEHPNNPLANSQLGFLYLKEGKTEKGVNLLISALQNKESEFELKSGILLYLSRDSVLSEVVPDSIYLNVIRSYPEEDMPYLIYGAHLLDYQKTEGLDYIRKALDINPKYEDSWGILIDYYSTQNDTINLLNTCREALEHFPDNSEFYLILGEVAWSLKDWDTVLASWRKAVSLLQNKNLYMASVVQGQIGDLYMELKQKENAYMAYDTALTYNENNFLVLNNFAYFLALDGIELQKAEKMSGKTIQADPKSPIFLDTYAWIYFKQGNYTLALMYIEQAYVNGGNQDADVLEHYGDILYKTGDEKKAKSMWQAAWEIRKEKNEDHTLLKKKAETGIYAE